MEIVFEIKIGNFGGKEAIILDWDGRAYPGVSSGGWFGGGTVYSEGEIERIIKNEKEWLFESYGRLVKTKIKIKDLRARQIGLMNFIKK